MSKKFPFRKYLSQVVGFITWLTSRTLAMDSNFCFGEEKAHWTPQLSTIKPLQKKKGNANVIRHTSQTLKGIKHTKQTMQRNTASLMKKGSIILLFSFLFFDSFCEALQFKGVILSRNVRIQCYYFVIIF